MLLILGMIAIKGGKKGPHEARMKLAFLVSAAFLGCSLHYRFVSLTGVPVYPVRYPFNPPA